MDESALKKVVHETINNPKLKFNSELMFQQPACFSILQALFDSKQYTYVRHAESEFNVWSVAAQNFGKMYPRNPALYDPGLTQKGIEQCQEFASPKVVFDVAYVSPARRTLQTVENLPVEYKRVVVTPLIRQRSKVRACVIGSPPALLQINFPHFTFQRLDRQYWWRHDYVDSFEEKLKKEDTQSVEARIGLFFLWTLLQTGSNILIVSHAMFLQVVKRLKYFQLPDNARPYPVQTAYIIQLFKRIQARTPTAKL